MLFFFLRDFVISHFSKNINFYFFSWFTSLKATNLQIDSFRGFPFSSYSLLYLYCFNPLLLTSNLKQKKQTNVLPEVDSNFTLKYINIALAIFWRNVFSSFNYTFLITFDFKSLYTRVELCSRGSRSFKVSQAFERSLIEHLNVSRSLIAKKKKN